MPVSLTTILSTWLLPLSAVNAVEMSDAVFALAPDLLVANGAAREGEQIEIVLTAEQRKTVEAAAA